MDQLHLDTGGHLSPFNNSSLVVRWLGHDVLHKLLFQKYILDRFSPIEDRRDLFKRYPRRLWVGEVYYEEGDRDDHVYADIVLPASQADRLALGGFDS